MDFLSLTHNPKISFLLFLLLLQQTTHYKFVSNRLLQMLEMEDPQSKTHFPKPSSPHPSMDFYAPLMTLKFLLLLLLLIIIIIDQYTFVTNKFLQMLNMNDSKENPLPQKKVRKETNRQMNKLLSPFYLLSFLKDPILILFPFTKPRYSHHINHEEKSQYWNSTH